MATPLLFSTKPDFFLKRTPLLLEEMVFYWLGEHPEDEVEVLDWLCLNGRGDVLFLLFGGYKGFVSTVYKSEKQLSPIPREYLQKMQFRDGITSIYPTPWNKVFIKGEYNIKSRQIKTLEECEEKVRAKEWCYDQAMFEAKKRNRLGKD